MVAALMLVRTLIWASLVPYYSCQGLTPAWMGRIGIRQTSQSPATSTTPLVVKETQKTKSSNRRSIRIRSTQTADLADVAKMLSTAAINPESSASDPWNWKTNMDRLLAKADIEALLRCRLQALQEGRKTLGRLEQYFLDNCHEDYHRTRLQLLWGNDRFRERVHKASRETGESNVWLNHNFALAPEDTSWLYHLQITAEDAATGQVVGFVEVAMLSNPVQRENESSKNDNRNNNNDDSCSLVYSPAITNLAVSEDWRRRGIATRLLETAARFARQEWEADEFGLYVEQANSAAIALYQRNGYTVQKSCAARAQLGDMFYMVCPMKKTTALVSR